MPTAVTSDVISDLSITTAKLANQAVTAAKVASGAVVQVVNAVTGSVSTGTTIIPADDTIPQITEGNEYMTLAVTPLSATNKLRIDVVCIATTSASSRRLCSRMPRLGLLRAWRRRRRLPRSSHTCA
jgi:hypothetical protein